MAIRMAKRLLVGGQNRDIKMRSFKRNANIKIFISNKKKRLELVNVCGCWRHWNVVDWREIDR